MDQGRVTWAEYRVEYRILSEFLLDSGNKKCEVILPLKWDVGKVIDSNLIELGLYMCVFDN